MAYEKLLLQTVNRRLKTQVWIVFVERSLYDTCHIVFGKRPALPQTFFSGL